MLNLACKQNIYHHVDNSSSERSRRTKTTNRSMSRFYISARLPRVLPPDFEPSEQHVLCGRGRHNCQHLGNRKYKIIIEQNVERYIAAKTKQEKASIVMDIVSVMRKDNGGFIDRDATLNRWYEIGDTLAREKVGHSLRFNIKANKAATKEAKPSSRKRSSPEVPSQDTSAQVATSDHTQHKQKKKSKIRHIKSVSIMDTENAKTPTRIHKTKNEKSLSIMKAASDLATKNEKNLSIMEAASGLATLCIPSLRRDNNVPPTSKVVGAADKKKISTFTKPSQEKRTTAVRIQQHHKGNPKIITAKMLFGFENLIRSSKDSQSKLLKWDREVMGLNKQHSQTMRDTRLSRKKLLKIFRSKTKRKSFLKEQQQILKEQTLLLHRSSKINTHDLPAKPQVQQTFNKSVVGVTSKPSSGIVAIHNQLMLGQQKRTQTSFGSLQQALLRANEKRTHTSFGSFGSSSNQQEKQCKPERVDAASRLDPSLDGVGQQQQLNRKRFEIIDLCNQEDEHEINRLKKEKDALLSALIESKAMHQQEQNKRLLLEKRAAIISALSVNEDALMHGCGVPARPQAIPTMNFARTLRAPVVGGGDRLSLLPFKLEEGGRSA